MQHNHLTVKKSILSFVSWPHFIYWLSVGLHNLILRFVSIPLQFYELWSSLFSYLYPLLALLLAHTKFLADFQTSMCSHVVLPIQHLGNRPETKQRWILYFFQSLSQLSRVRCASNVGRQEKMSYTARERKVLMLHWLTFCCKYCFPCNNFAPSLINRALTQTTS